MNTISNFRLCCRFLRQRHALAKMAKKLSAGTVALEQRRHYRLDDRYNFSKTTREQGTGAKLLADEGFDPRYDERHFKSYYRNEEPNYETRRRITQDTADHQRRQKRIIAENKLKWQSRSEPKPPGLPEYDYKKLIKARKGRGQRKQSPAEKYSQRRRRQRQTEVKRQERELQKSRQGYKLPKSELEVEAPKEAKEEVRPYASRAWLDKQARKDEAKYWHTWYTCPSERRQETAEEDSADEQSTSSTQRERRGLVSPPQNYDGSVRRYQTQSTQLSNKYQTVSNAIIRRKPTGMEKQYLLAKDFVRLTSSTEDTKRPASLLHSHVSRVKKSAYNSAEDEDELRELELPGQPPRSKLAWQGLPRPVYARFNGIKRAMSRQSKTANVKCVRPPVQPPRFRMTVRSNALKRKQTPTNCFSKQLSVNPSYLAHSGYGRQSVCEAWRCFTHGHNIKSVN